jgi:hypothetical protein
MTRPTGCRKVTAGRPGVSQRLPSAARSRIRNGWSPTSQRSTTNLASSRQEKKPMYSWSAVACRGRTGHACSPPNATGTRHTGSSTGMPATWKGAVSARAGSTGRRRSAATSAGRRSPASGRTRSSTPSGSSTTSACLFPTRSRSPARRCCWSSSGTRTAPARPASPRSAPGRPTSLASGASSSRPWQPSPARASRTATCPHTTCSSITGGW